MKWSLSVGTWAGIKVYVHATFLILLAWVAVIHWRADQSIAAALAGTGFVLALFACVLLHEFGHALTASRYGIGTRDITLLPIGGLARLERMPDDPWQELVVALAGPAVNVVIAAVLLAAIMVAGWPATPGDISTVEGSFLERLLAVNVLLAAFNLLPAFPMDGGRVLRAVLAMRMDYARATQLAATVGQGMALVFVIVGLFINPFLLFIALFVWIGATQEAAFTQVRSALAGIPLQRVMVTDFRTLMATDTLERAVELLLAGAQHDFPVMDGDRVVGVLLRADLLTALARKSQASHVANVMRECHMAQASEMVEGALQRLQDRGCPTIPVLQGDRLVGLLTMDNIGEFLSVRSALRDQVVKAP